MSNKADASAAAHDATIKTSQGDEPVSVDERALAEEGVEKAKAKVARQRAHLAGATTKDKKDRQRAHLDGALDALSEAMARLKAIKQ